MQNGCLMQTPRRRGPNVWEFRWRELGSDGRRVHRRIVVGTVEQFRDETRAVRAILGLRREINSHNAQLTPRLLTLAQLVEHYKQRELALDNTWKSYSTKQRTVAICGSGLCHGGGPIPWRAFDPSRWSTGSETLGSQEPVAPKFGT
jgi:hypothetical protein